MRHSALERLNAPGFLIFQRFFNGPVKTSSRKVRFKARIDGVRMVLVQPDIELLDLVRSQMVYGAFDFLNGAQLHDFVL